MKIKIEIDDSLMEEEIVIRCKSLSEDVISIQKRISDAVNSRMQLEVSKGEKEYYITIDEILFFETEGKTVTAHTADKMYETQYRLYELEEMLPGYFMRISKSTIVNLNQIYSITRNLTASSVIEFSDSIKKVYVSRNYYKSLIERMGEKRKRL